MTTKHPEIYVDLVGVDGNAFAIMNAVAKPLKRAGFHEDAAEYINRFMAGTYEEGIAMASEYVTIGSPDEWDDGEGADVGQCWNCGIPTTYADEVCEDCDVADDDFDYSYEYDEGE